MKYTHISSSVFRSGIRMNTIRTQALAITSIFFLLAFSFAITVSAATLTRQLEVGSRGQDVSDLQTFLAKDPTIYPQGLVTGYFGLLTKSAVSNFQSRNGISAIGRVGPVTLAALNIQMNGDIVSPAMDSINIARSNTSATFSWNTNENASAVIYYSTAPLSMIEGSPTTGVTIGGFSFLVNSNLQSSHVGTLSNLSPNTTYYYVLYVKDAFGNESVTWPATFQTLN